MLMGPSNIILLQRAAAKIFNNAAVYYKTKILIRSQNTCKVIGHFAFMWSTNQHIKCLNNSSFPATSQQQQQEITIKSSSNRNKKSSNDPSASRAPPPCQVLLRVLDGHDFTEFSYQLLEAGVISLNLLMREEAEAQDQSKFQATAVLTFITDVSDRLTSNLIPVPHFSTVTICLALQQL